MQKESMDEIKGSNLVQMSHEFLDIIVKKTGFREDGELTKEKIQEAKLVLGFLNAADRTIRTKLQYFRMNNVTEKLEAIKKKSETL